MPDIVAVTPAVSMARAGSMAAGCTQVAVTLEADADKNILIQQTPAPSVGWKQVRLHS
jgi:hypothetical protein